MAAVYNNAHVIFFNVSSETADIPRPSRKQHVFEILSYTWVDNVKISNKQPNLLKQEKMLL